MDRNGLSEMTYGYFKKECPKCGAEVSAYGRVYDYRVTDREKHGREEGEPRGSSYVETAGETLSATCPSCGHSWGPWVAAGNRLKAAREAAPANARYWLDPVSRHWEYLWNEGRWIGTGVKLDHTPKSRAVVKGFEYDVEEGFDSSRFRS